MALTDYQKHLIDAVLESNLAEARLWALHSINEDASKKNHWWCENRKKTLEKLVNITAEIEIPGNLKGFLNTAEQLPPFIPERYYLSKREEKLLEDIVTMRQVSDELSAMGINYLNTTLLFGESGTGKTMFGRYVANKFDLPFLYLNFAQLIDSYLGSTSKNLFHVFQFVKTIPCVFMIDEIDSIAIARGMNENGGTSGEIGRITITLMQELDKFTNQQIVIAATNRYDMLDNAVKRRFVKKHEIKKPCDLEERIALVRTLLDDIPYTYDNQELNEFCSREPICDNVQYKIIGSTIEAIARAIERKDTCIKL